MRKKLLSSIALLSIITISLLVVQTSCNTDTCKNTTCQNGGACTNGMCNCPSGYNGTNCQNKWVNKFVANWNGFNLCNSTNWKGSITPSSAGNTQFNISNFANFGTSAQFTCSLVDSLHFTVNQQIQNGYTILSGSGVMTASTDTLVISFSAKQPNDTVLTCSSVMVKQ